MSDAERNTKQLLDEIAFLRGRLKQLEEAEEKWKLAEKEIRKSESDKSLILGSLLELITYQDRSLRILWANKAAGDSVGLAPEDLIGRYCYEIWHGRKKPCSNCPVAKSIETGRSQEAEMTSPDGRIWYIRGCPVLNEQGEPVGAVEVTLEITQRKRAQEELKAKNLAIESSINAFTISNSCGKTLYVNPAFIRMWGYEEPAEVIGKNTTEFWRDEKRVLDVIETLKKEGEWRGELSARRKDDSYFDAQVSASMVKGRAGQPDYLMASFVDITERKKTEQALRDSEQKYKTLVENIPGMVYRAYPGWSAEIFFGCEEICGYTPRELNSREKNWLSVIHPDDKERVLREGAEIVNEPASIVQVYRITTKSGHVRWVEDRKTSVFNHKGRFIGIDGIVLDVTERKEAALSLERQREFELLITDISKQFVNVSTEQADEQINLALKALGEFAQVDRSYIFQFFEDRRKTSNTHEWHVEGVAPQIDNLQDLSVDTVPWWMDKLNRFENVYIPDVEKLPARAENEKKILQAQSIKSLIATPMVHNRRLVGFVGFDSVRCKRTWSEQSIAMLTIVSEIFTNTLMRRRIQQELDTHYEKMRRAEQLASLGTVSATIAHELSQPLTVIRLFLQQGARALKDDNDLDKVEKVIDDCLDEIAKAARTVDRFRRFARKAAPVYITEVNLVEVARGIVEILAGSARMRKLELSLDIKRHPPNIIGNSVELEQMFFVLIQNAIQAADGKTQRDMKITIAAKSGQIQLTFADTCGGIKEEYMDKIFEPFFTTKPANVGTGLGLCILERIVKRHGGAVSVKNKEGYGTTFYITLPIKN
ncbi:MAG TPA: PAS domain S-box protein [Planctomycetes bacterium]|nr:PAS domain S-box protein [Planctomycetota bacterium]HIJ71751.1 PAS domain S-box protein [Planctomycetota bacterium]